MTKIKKTTLEKDISFDTLLLMLDIYIDHYTVLCSRTLRKEANLERVVREHLKTCISQAKEDKRLVAAVKKGRNDMGVSEL